MPISDHGECRHQCNGCKLEHGGELLLSSPLSRRSARIGVEVGGLSGVDLHARYPLADQVDQAHTAISVSDETE